MINRLFGVSVDELMVLNAKPLVQNTVCRTRNEPESRINELFPRPKTDAGTVFAYSFSLGLSL